jgi:hypothetical protein
MKGSKWENGFIKNDIPRNIDSALRYIKALEPLMHVTIAQKNTTCGSEFKFVLSVGTKVRPTGATEDTEAGVVRCGAKKFL